jgi:formate dehydrogenase major subunit
MVKGFLEKWPVMRQIRNGDVHGTGENAMSGRTRELAPRMQDCQVTRSICPYCGVGCGQLVYHKAGQLVSIEGDPDSPVSRGHLCPKGSATFQLHTHPGRLKVCYYRAPYAREWRILGLEECMDMIAERMWATRERTFQERDEQGNAVMHTLGMAHLGGATLDNEENYLIKKLFAAGMGMSCISNQARI